MFLDLIQLYRKNQNIGKIPLEDFNTEVFANILKMYPKVCEDFCLNFLKLPLDNYIIKTQYHQFIASQKPNCIIDLVLIGDSNICFLESKVESIEGDEQLLRYEMALIENHSEKGKYLLYCTKYSDPKKVDLIRNTVSFNQIRWYQIAKFLKQYKENPIIKSYLEFLNQYKMSQDNTLKSENLIAMENMRKTIEIVEFHIENSKHAFIELFGGTSLNKNANWDQIKDKNRVCYYKDNILKTEKNAWSEILYAIEFGELKMTSQIYVDKNHESYQDFVDLKVPENFKKVEFDFGAAIQLQEELGKYLNNIYADKHIQDWFIDSFKQIKSLINTNELQWNLKK
ncbi:MAG: PD-(D/E)XK nuclease family protein [Flavobacteriaceae bacterium]|nr:PD-(D/E)XK nuclease family protein [Flavobacteriaceae bacterium]